MIIRLFSIFDPFTVGSFRNWLFFFMLFFFFFFFKNIKIGAARSVKLKVLNIVYKDLLILIKKIPFISILFIRLFFSLLVRNYLGIIVYIFPTTRHLSLTLTFRFLFWLSLFFSNLIFNYKNFLSHLVPEGISYGLAPLIVLIETLRNLIRPFILGVRIRANMIAGHLLMALVAGIIVNVGRLTFIRVSVGISLLVILETIVSIIQAYIFTILIGLYFSE